MPGAKPPDRDFAVDSSPSGATDTGFSIPFGRRSAALWAPQSFSGGFAPGFIRPPLRGSSFWMSCVDTNAFGRVEWRVGWVRHRLGSVSRQLGRVRHQVDFVGGQVRRVSHQVRSVRRRVGFVRCQVGSVGGQAGRLGAYLRRVSARVGGVRSQVGRLERQVRQKNQPHHEIEAYPQPHRV